MFWLFGVFFSNSLSLVVECFSCFQGLEGVTLFFEVGVWFFWELRLSEIPDYVKTSLGGLHWTHSRKTAEELTTEQKLSS